MASQRNLYQTKTLLTRTLRVAYPVETGSIILRTELDWDRNVTPVSVGSDGIWTFRVEARHPFVGKAYEHRTFFSRLHHFMIVSDAFVVVPGGIGTLLEMSIAWQLLQVRNLYNTPLILVGKMWAELVEWAGRTMSREGSELASPIDFTIPRCVNTVAEIVALIRENRAVWLTAQPPP